MNAFSSIETKERKKAFLEKEPEGRIEDYSKTSTAAGIAYHEVLALWLSAKKMGTEISLKDITIMNKLRTKRAQNRLLGFMGNFK